MDRTDPADLPAALAGSTGMDVEPAPRTPRWVKVFAGAFLVLVVLVVAMMLSGHGPGRHM